MVVVVGVTVIKVNTQVGIGSYAEENVSTVTHTCACCCGVVRVVEDVSVEMKLFMRVLCSGWW